MPGADTLIYGGNTTCIEVRGKQNELVILDAGTGIYPLGLDLLASDLSVINIFISHTHWDHIQGLPMFQPSFSHKYKINVYGPRDLESGLGIKERLAKQMDRHFFPIQLDDLSSRINFFDIEEGEKIRIGSLKVSGFKFHHPVVNFGYRIEDELNSVVFTGDHEWMSNDLELDHPGWKTQQKKIELRTQKTIEFMKDTDVLIIDTAYTVEEYKTKKGWGHGNFDSSIVAAREANAKQVYLTHHEPSRTDAALEICFQDALQKNRTTKKHPVFFLAKEREKIKIE